MCSEAGHRAPSRALGAFGGPASYDFSSPHDGSDLEKATKEATNSYKLAIYRS